MHRVARERAKFYSLLYGNYELNITCNELRRNVASIRVQRAYNAKCAKYPSHYEAHYRCRHLLRKKRDGDVACRNSRQGWRQRKKSGHRQGPRCTEKIRKRFQEPLVGDEKTWNLITSSKYDRLPE